MDKAECPADTILLSGYYLDVKGALGDVEHQARDLEHHVQYSEILSPHLLEGVPDQIACLLAGRVSLKQACLSTNLFINNWICRIEEQEKDRHDAIS